MTFNIELIKTNLSTVVAEIGKQSEIGDQFPSNMQSFPEQIEQLREWIEGAGEYEIAYELLISILEAFPFHMTALASIKLVEVSLLMKFKTERPEDARFDFRA